jgi:amino acid transporter
MPGGSASPATGQDPGHADCPVCPAPDQHDDWNARQRGETPLQRADRAYGEILQEIRVAQTGVQILFAFLLTLAFTNRFESVTQFQRVVYVITLLLCAAATALLIAPAAFHRVVYRRRLKQHLVRVANRLALAGLGFLVLAMVSAMLLILDVVTGPGWAFSLVAVVLIWFMTWWFIVPYRSRLRHPPLDPELDEEDSDRRQASRIP